MTNIPAEVEEYSRWEYILFGNKIAFKHNPLPAQIPFKPLGLALIPKAPKTFERSFCCARVCGCSWLGSLALATHLCSLSHLSMAHLARRAPTMGPHTHTYTHPATFRCSLIRGKAGETHPWGGDVALGSQSEFAAQKTAIMKSKCECPLHFLLTVWPCYGPGPKQTKELRLQLKLNLSLVSLQAFPSPATPPVNEHSLVPFPRIVRLLCSAAA